MAQFGTDQTFNFLIDDRDVDLNGYLMNIICVICLEKNYWEMIFYLLNGVGFISTTAFQIIKKTDLTLHWMKKTYEHLYMDKLKINM